MKLYCDLSDYEPWSGAVSFYEEIVDQGLTDDLENLLEEIYPEGLSTVQLNDLLWFEQDWLRSALGMEDSSNA